MRRYENVPDPDWFWRVDSLMSIGNQALTRPELLLLGVDGGGTRCRARLATVRGAKLAEAVAGPANIRLGLEQSFAALLQATQQCLAEAGLRTADAHRIVACLALAGASEPGERAAAKRHWHPYREALVTTDAEAACVGAHAGRDGAIVVVGTGSIGWAKLGGQDYRVGGWGLPLSDEGSGAWLGREAVRRVLWAHDGRMPWSPLLTALLDRFERDPHGIIRWAAHAMPRDFGSLAPMVVDHAERGDTVAGKLMRLAAVHIDKLAARMVAIGARRLALMGGLAETMEPWLADATRRNLVQPAGDALDGALRLAAAAAGVPLEHAFPEGRR
jgi:glucosamine kinase